VGHAHKRAYAPGGGDAEGNQKGNSHDPSESVALAPTLEHGDHSNREQDEGGDGENLDPHDGLHFSGLRR
jgi:hypothetical protein